MSNPYQAGFGSCVASAKDKDLNVNEKPQSLTFLEKKDLVKRLIPYISTYKKKIILIFLLSLLVVLSHLYIPILIGQAIDFMAGYHQVDFASLKTVLLKLVVVITIGSIAWKYQGSLNSEVSACATRDLRKKAFEKLVALPIKTIDSTSHGDLASRVVNDVEQVGEGLLQALNQLFTGSITIVGTLVFMVYISPKLTILVVCLTPLSILVALLIAKYSNSYFTSQMGVQGEIAGYVKDMFSNMDIINNCGYTNTSIEKYNALNDELNHVGLRAQFISSLSNPATRFVNNIIYALVAYFGFMTVVSGGALTVGSVQALLSYSFQYTKPFNEISATITQLEAAFASLVRLFELFDLEEDKAQAEEINVLKRCSGAIKFEHVSFGYNSNKMVLKDINFEVKPGQKVAIVGHTGCGKTTLMNLIMRYYTPCSGTIYLDGIDISTMKKSDLRKHLGVVLQNSWLVKGSILENISFAQDDVLEEDIKQAAKSASVHSFISHLEDGYETLLQGETSTISKGQRQLLCVARCMLKNPEVLLLDEATSSIDSKTEQDVQNAFDSMIKGRTSLIVAHRLSTIKNADLILVMDEGRIVESGTHNELLRQKGLYASLCETSVEGTSL